MAGAHIELEVTDAEVTAVLGQLLARLDDPSPALAEIGEYGVESTRERIETQNAENPLSSWEPHSEGYAKSRRKLAHHPGEMLILYGDLVGTFAWQADAAGVEWGSARVYAGAQQFGRPEINLPAREFLGDTAHDDEEILGIMYAWLSGAT